MSNQPIQYCDLVMKGGVASGVVYPPAVVALAEHYTFRNIGGTSVGAIAAAAAAAAECGRRHGRGDPFARLTQLRNDLARPGFFVSLFKPDRESAALFRLVYDIATTTGTLTRLLTVLRAGLETLVGMVAVLLAIGAPLGLWYTQLVPGSGALYFALGALATIIALTLSIACVVWQGSTALGRDAFGLCSGFDPASTVTAPRLTNWLSALVNELAGITDRPLTFGDLWNAPQDVDPEREERAINLEMITTNLTLGRPYRFPLTDSDHHRFCFEPSELAEYFPADVIAWMTGHQAQRDHPVVRLSDGKPLVPLPEMEDLPVIVATRLSLSFPILFRAVPLYAVDFSRRLNEGVPPGQPHHAERCWFSDGGISSNFPIHFFDAPLPRWPTFAIDLDDRHPDYPKTVWMSGERGGLLEHWSRFDDALSPGERLVGFLAAIFEAASGWRDVLQAHLPAFRDRIVHIGLTATEGGLNLNMPSETIGHLCDYGSLAGATLVEQFNFEHHVCVRHWSGMCAMQETFAVFEHAYDHPLPQDQAAWRAVRCEQGEVAIGTTVAQKDFACHETAALAGTGRRWQADPQGFCSGAPHPRPEWRLTPRL
jgi:hypothetical protein